MSPSILRWPPCPSVQLTAQLALAALLNDIPGVSCGLTESRWIDLMESLRGRAPCFCAQNAALLYRPLLLFVGGGKRAGRGLQCGCTVCVGLHLLHACVQRAPDLFTPLRCSTGLCGGGGVHRRHLHPHG